MCEAVFCSPLSLVKNLDSNSEHVNGIHAGVTTNGSALTPKNAERTVLARPFNVNISCDAPNAEVHDYVRGSKGLFDKLSKGVKYLREYQETHGISFPIIMKPTVHKYSFRLLPEIVEWAQRLGATAVNFQPLDRFSMGLKLLGG